MSTTPRFSLQDKERRRSSSFHRRSDSGELDVFEAERYFSAASESLPQKIGALSTRQFASLRQGRASLDIPMIMRSHTPQEILLDTIKPTKEKKKHKQPSSPGGKLASFFNSLINQTVSKKKKSASKSVKDIVEDDSNSPGGWRRKQRSSISHFSSSTTTTRSTSKTTTVSETDSKSIKSYSSGFRTPPPYIINLPIKPYKEFKAARPTSEKHYSVSKDSDFYYKAGSEKRINWVDRIIPEAPKESCRDFKRFNMEEDGAESDSSSDLFELQLNNNHHYHHPHKLGYCASDLPVYETTHLDTIKISSGTPITNGPFRN